MTRTYEKESMCLFVQPEPSEQHLFVGALSEGL
jgi:hypothetical protein